MNQAATAPALPSNLYKPKGPLTGKLIENRKLTGDDSPNDVRHLVFDISGTDYWYVDGQSVGVLPPGEDPRTGKPNKLRLYSIASQGVSPEPGKKVIETCVKRLVYKNEAGEEVRGVCSNYLCDLEPGAELQLTGPVGKEFVLPTAKNINYVFIATGTGIAPFRAFLQTRFNERKAESGQTHLFFGVQYSSDILYREELESFQQFDNYGLHVAISREQKNADGSRKYVQHLLAEQAETILPLLEQKNTHVYICGLRGMESGILETLDAAAQARGKSWESIHNTALLEHRWHVEVY